MCWPSGAKQFAENLNCTPRRTSAAKAGTEGKALIAAVNRCAAQNQMQPRPFPMQPRLFPLAVKACPSRNHSNGTAEVAFERAVNAALKCVRGNSSFAPSGLDHFPHAPTAYAVGCSLTPLRG